MKYPALPLTAAAIALSGCAGSGMNTRTALTAAQVLAQANAQPAAPAYPATPQAAVPAYPGMAGAAVAAATGQAPGLTDLLTGRLGISPQQATGAAGAVFGLARQRMAPASFGQLARTVPGMNQYLAAAPRVPYGVPSGLAGTAGALLGNQGGTLGSLAVLAGAFQSLGLNYDMIGQLVPVLLQYVQTQGGAGTMGLLQSALY